MLKIGWASREFTPKQPAMIQGQMHTRIGRQAMDPITVTAMAIEGETPEAKAILLSFDLAGVPHVLEKAVASRLAARVSEVTAESLVMVATHTHESLVLEDVFYPYPGGDVMRPADAMAWVADQAAAAGEAAWKTRSPQAVECAFGHAVVGHNRRATYADGTSAMYGATNKAEFMGIEGFEDHSVDMLFAWTPDGKLAGVMLGIPCPSQVDEGLEVFSADYWHEVRVELRRRLGADLSVLPMCGAAGDQSPHFLVYGREEERMRKRRGLTERQEIAVRVADAVERALACTKPGLGTTVFAHQMRRVGLPSWKTTKAQRDWADAERCRSVERGMDPGNWWPARLAEVVDGYDSRRRRKPYPVDVHALRIGDLGLVTSPFELYLDFAIRIKARSPAPQTVVVQLAAGTGWYLPTERAVKGGSYGAMPAVAVVGPEGGQKLVDESLAMLTELFPAAGT